MSVGAVVCTLDSISSIEECLKSLTLAGLDEIIVVDGGSVDGTLEVVSEMGHKLVRDPGTGLGLARNLGVNELSTDFVLMVGSDNVLTKETIIGMVSKLEEGYLGVSCRTQVIDKTYLGRCLDLMWKAKIKPGIKENIGTPQLFRRQTLNDFPFSLVNSFSDDTELCQRLTASLGGLFFTVDSFCLEIGKTSLSEFRRRYQIYGLSDWELYSQNRNLWSRRRKVKSILHPLNTELLVYLKGQNIFLSLYSMPILLYSTFLRYKSWIKKWRKERAKLLSNLK